MPHFMSHLNGTGGGAQGDPRPLLEKLRRKELEAIMDAESIPHPPQPPATAARQLIQSYGVDVAKYIDDNNEFRWPEEGGKDLDAMRIQDLRKYCAHEGIEWTMSDNKEALKAKIRAVHQEA